MTDETGPIQILELFADGSCRLQIRNHAGRGYRWQSETGHRVAEAARRFVELDPDYVPPMIATREPWWRRMFGTMAALNAGKKEGL